MNTTNKDMTDEELRVKVEALLGNADLVPDYLEDLDAWFAVEDELLMNPEKHDKAYLYDMNLLKVTGAVDEETGLLRTCFMWHATARQRALAFVKTMEAK